MIMEFGPGPGRMGCIWRADLLCPGALNIARLSRFEPHGGCQKRPVPLTKEI